MGANRELCESWSCRLPAEWDSALLLGGCIALAIVPSATSWVLQGRRRPPDLVFRECMVAASLMSEKQWIGCHSGRRGGRALQAHVAVVGGPVAAVVDVCPLVALAHACAWGRVDLQPALVLQHVHRPLLLLHLQTRCRAERAVETESCKGTRSSYWLACKLEGTRGILCCFYNGPRHWVLPVILGLGYALQMP